MLDLSKTYTVKEIEELPYFIYLKTFNNERVAITDSIADIDNKKFIIGIIHNPYNKLTEKRPSYINVNNIQAIELTDKAAKAEIAIKEFLSK